MKRSILVLAIVTLLAAGLVSTAGATQPEGPVTFTTVLDFSVFPFRGEYEVIQGADILGCQGGTFVDHWPGLGPDNSSIVRKEFYCERDPADEGPDFVVKLNPNPTIPGEGDLNGHWVIWKGMRDFEGLCGQGEVSAWFDFENEKMYETFTGAVHRHP